MAFVDDVRMLFAPAKRSIQARDYRTNKEDSIILPQVTISENHHDRMIITDHPVDKNANITDHAYPAPATLSIQIGWSITPTISINVFRDNFTNQFQINDLNKLYDTFITYMRNREIFQVYTGKRKYQNLLIEAIRTETDEHNENILILDIDFKEVIIVSTQTINLANSTSPETTTDPVNNGNQTLIEGTPSAGGAIPIQ